MARAAARLPGRPGSTPEHGFPPPPFSQLTGAVIVLRLRRRRVGPTLLG